ncbi:MAG TPA: MFS transporter [Thermomicrobiales bacterium]
MAQFSDTGDRLTMEVEAERPLSLWQNRDYMLLWAGQAVSSFGSQITQLTFPLLVLALTGSPAQAGFVGALRALPFALLSLPAGALVDRWNRKRLMIWCDIGRALALGSVPLALVFGGLGLPQLAIVSIIEGTLFLFFNLAESSSLPQVVPREQLPGALTQNQVTDSLSQLLGPTLGGALYAVGAAVPFVADAVSYTLSLLTLLFIRTPLQEERTAPPGRLRDEIVEGIAWLWRQGILRFVALLTGGLMVCSVGYPLIMIVLGERIGASSFEIGLIFAGGGAGSIVGGLLTPWLQRRFRFGPLFIWLAWFWAITWLFFLFAPNVLTLGLANTAAFIVVPIYMITQYRYRLAATPDRLQGRMNALFRLIVWGSQPLGVALAGLLLERIGAEQTIIWLFIPQLLLAIVATAHAGLRRAGWEN